MKDKYGNEHSENNGQFVSKGGDTRAEEKRYEEIMGKETIAKEKVASVHIDLTKDNVLPKLNEEDLKTIGLEENKNVLVKLSVIERNKVVHSDIKDDDIQRIVGETLYSSTEIFKGDKKKPYYTFVKEINFTKEDGSHNSQIVLLDIDLTKQNFEVVHWHITDEAGLKRMKNKLK